jgi:hypothetical protein
MQDCARERKELVEQHRKLLEQASGQLSSRMSRVNEREERIVAMRNDLVVLVRTSVGAPMAVYHHADRPCGLASGRGFRAVLEGEARWKLLKRCVHCRWPVASDLAECS